MKKVASSKAFKIATAVGGIAATVMTGGVAAPLAAKALGAGKIIKGVVSKVSSLKKPIGAVSNIVNNAKTHVESIGGIDIKIKKRSAPRPSLLVDRSSNAYNDDSSGNYNDAPTKGMPQAAKLGLAAAVVKFLGII